MTRMYEFESLELGFLKRLCPHYLYDSHTEISSLYSNYLNNNHCCSVSNQVLTHALVSSHPSLNSVLVLIPGCLLVLESALGWARQWKEHWLRSPANHCSLMTGYSFNSSEHQLPKEG